MIPKSGNRFSEKIMLHQIARAEGRFEEKSSPYNLKRNDFRPVHPTSRFAVRTAEKEARYPPPRSGTKRNEPGEGDRAKRGGGGVQKKWRTAACTHQRDPQKEIVRLALRAQAS